MHTDLTLLDCTLRDGGYYNDWDFDAALVGDYLSAMARCGVDVVEIGFRFTPKSRFLGPFAYTTDAFLDSLDLPGGLTYGVMINAGDYLKEDPGPAQLIRRHFSPAVDSPVDLVRIAAHVGQVESCGLLVAELSRLGYRIGLNIMQANSCTPERLGELARAAVGFGGVEALYFADSLGNMDAAAVQGTVAALRRAWNGPVGFHGHDNMGYGVSNSLAALEAGAGWIDATVRGMGRGAGNTQMEYLAAELQQRGLKDVRPAPLYDFANNGIAALHAQYGWGKNLFYYLAGLHEVHPTYVQDMLTDERFDANDIIALIEVLGRSGGRAYSPSGVDNALLGQFAQAEGSWSADGAFAGRQVLLVAAGPSAERHWPALARFIEGERPHVIALNPLSFVPVGLVDSVACCHPGRMLQLLGSADGWRDKPLLTPKDSLPADLQRQLDGRDVLDYGMAVQRQELQVTSSGCVVPAPLVAAYAMAAAAAGGAREILVAGFDGYDGANDKFRAMNGFLEDFQAQHPDLPVTSLTPTRYNLTATSVYAM